MRYFLPALLASALFPSPVSAEPNLDKGFDGALRGCELWLLDPGSWAEGTGPFIKALGLGEQMGLVERVEEVNLPPKQLRRANRYWRINSTPTAGYVLVVSEQLPMCHITGGGNADLQPSVERVLSSPEFNRRWQSDKSFTNGDMETTVFRSQEDSALSITISRATGEGQQLDRVQVLATALYQTGN